MKRGITLGILIVFVLAVSVFVIAKPSSNIPYDVVPAHAIEVSKGVFSLGYAKDPQSNKIVQGFLFVEDKKAHAKPSWAGGGKNKDSGTSTCYTLMAKDTKWKATEPYVTGSGVDLGLMETSLNTWDSESSFEIFGSGLSGLTDGADGTSPDGKNEVELQNLGPTSTIAYTIVWGVFSGPPRARELIEWDMVFNTDYDFGDANVDPSVMDFQNIAVHEAGHALGLTHPEDTCIEETMYAYADFGETKKRTLEAGDLTGLGKLY